MPEYCVTGGTGFIGAYLVQGLLDKGRTVRTTVRNPGDEEKIGFLLKLDGADKRLKLVKAGLMVEGSFDENIDSVDGAFHAASPVLVPYDDNIQDNLIDPCFRGTLNVLKSCSRSRSIKRVVLTSSCSAIRYREDLWYAYAKTMGEQEAWKFEQENAIDLVVVNPSFVTGPLLAPQPTSTLLTVLAIIKGLSGQYPNTAVGFVHIDDVIEAHVLATEKTNASGWLICSSEVAHWSEIISMLKANYPSYPYENKILQPGHSGFKTIPEMFDDCIKSFQGMGLL